MYPPTGVYTLLDIDNAWYTLLSGFGPLSDQTEVPVAVDAQSPEDVDEPIPAIAVELVAMMPNLQNYSGYFESFVGYVRDENGFPLEEIHAKQLEHYRVVYCITTRCANPLHDREILFKMGSVLTPRVTIQLAGLEGVPRLTAHMSGSNRVRPQKNTAKKAANGEQTLERQWWYYIDIAIPHEDTIHIPVTRYFGLTAGTLVDGEFEAHATGTFEKGRADINNANESDVVDDGEELGYKEVRESTDDT